MVEKIKEMFGSIRFWYAIGLGLVFYFEAVGTMDGATATALKAFFVAGMTMRTVDSAATKIGA